MRRFMLALAAAALVAASVPAVAATPTRAKQVVKDDFFKPKRVDVKKGGKVVWRWRGSNPHNVAIMKPGSSKVVKRSPVKTSGKYVSRFRRTGKWRIICEIHPDDMRGRVVVKSS